MRPPPAFPCLVEPGASPQVMGTAIEFALYAALAARRPVCGELGTAREGLARVERWSIGLQRSFGLSALHARVDAAYEVLHGHRTPDLAPETARAALTLARVACVARAELWFLCDLPRRAHHIVSDPKLGEISELTRLHALLPLAHFDGYTRVRFQPAFGQGSCRLGGADGDLLADDTLYEIKTRPRCRPDAEDLRQLIGYAALANRFGVDGESGTKVKQLGIVFPRAGAVFCVPLRRLVTEGCEDCVVDAILAFTGQVRSAS
jgi:hypothetical protein